MIPLGPVGAAGVLGYAANKLWNHYHPQANKWDQDEQARLLKENEAYLGLGKNFQITDDPFTAYEEKRQNGVELFEKAKGINYEQIKGSPALKQAVNEALQPSQALEVTKKNFQQEVKALNELYKRHRPEAVIQTTKDAINEATIGLKKQHAHEKKVLKEELGKNKENIKKELSITDEQFEKLQKNMLAELDKTHKGQLEEFNKTTAQALNKIHEAQANDIARVNFLASLKKDNFDMLRQLIQSQRAGIVAEMGGDPNDPNAAAINLTNIQIKDLKKFSNKGGKEITQDESGVFRIKFGMPLFSPSYYLLGEKVEEDLTLMAKAVKAKGYKKIKMNVNFDDPEVAEARAKQAYKAAVEAGFPMKDPNDKDAKDSIQIIKNGQLFDPEKSFSPEEMRVLRERAQKIASERGNLKPTQADKKVDSTVIKKEIKALKDDHNAQERFAQQAQEKRKEIKGKNPADPMKIEFEVKENDDALNEKRAQQAFKAAIDNGFTPDNIHVVKKSDDKPDTPFQCDPNEKAKYEAEAKKNDDRLNKIENGEDEDETLETDDVARPH